MSDEAKPLPGRLIVKKVFLGLILAFLIIEIVMLPFPWTVASLRTENPKLTAVMKERIRQARAKRQPYKIRQSYVPLSRISDAMVHAVIVGEDGTFYENHERHCRSCRHRGRNTDERRQTFFECGGRFRNRRLQIV